jgi:penicillin-binding protein 1A
VLAGITQNPSAYDPIIYPENNRERQEVVLEHMLSQGYITREEYDSALKEDVYTKIAKVNKEEEKVDNKANSYFVDALIRQVLRDLQNPDLMKDSTLNQGNPLTAEQATSLLYSGGLRIYSTQDSDIQAIVDKQCSENSGNFPKGTKYYLNYALTVTAPDGSQTNYDSNSMQAYFLGKDEDYSIMYTSESRAKEDIDALRSHFNVTQLHFLATDGYANHMRKTLDEMDEETFQLFLRYHFATCERVDMIGYSNHTLDIFRKD